ncbi:MAG: tetratricopeptide repeat protein, partial [Nitrospira sp.]|nr:tetratricopeptide repeat protein [Nitrospira sp.]
FGPRHFYASNPTQVREATGQMLFSLFASELRGGNLSFMAGQEDNRGTFLLKLAQACLKNGRGPFALAYADQSLKERETAEGHYIRGKILLTLLEYLEAANPELASGTVNGGIKAAMEQREKILGETKATFTKAIQIDSTATMARFELGKLQFKSGNLNAAKEQYLTILKQDPNSYEAHVNLGAIYLQQGKLDQALPEYQRVLPLFPQDPEIHFKLGLIYAKRAQYGLAMQAYEKTLSMIPNHTEAHYNLALVAELLGDPEKAEIHFNKFLELAPVSTPYASYRKVAENQLKRLKMQETKD